MPSPHSILLLAFLGGGDSLNGWGIVGLALAWLVLGVLPLVAFSYLIYFLLSLPLRRQERARFFLDLLENGLNKGLNIERTIIGISQSRESSVGARFHLLAAHLLGGCNLIEALERVSSLLPPQVIATLQIGDKTGNMGRVLPACKKMLTDGTSRTSGAINYLMVIAFGMTPITLVIFGMVAKTVLPKFYEIMNDMAVPVPGMTQTMLEDAGLLIIPLILAVLAFYLAALIYVGGPRLTSWLKSKDVSWGDSINCRLPWQRKRLQRDFSMILSALLDAEIPEPQAVVHAAASTANTVFMRRAAAVVDDLRRGIGLSEAIQRIDDTGELRWRLANAGFAERNFSRALNGWHESLDAQAFQAEQATAQLMTAGIVLFNGLVVGLIAVGVFKLLITIINQGLLW